jgi:hypothetical protein
MPFEIRHLYWMDGIIYLVFILILPKIDEKIDTAVDNRSTTKVAAIHCTNISW